MRPRHTAVDTEVSQRSCGGRRRGRRRWRRRGEGEEEVEEEEREIASMDDLNWGQSVCVCPE